MLSAADAREVRTVTDASRAVQWATYLTDRTDVVPLAAHEQLPPIYSTEPPASRTKY